MRLRIRSLAFLVAVLLLASVAVAPAKSRKKWPTYKGAWFSVAYPPGFKARASMPSASYVGEYDSAYFRSPDGKAEFYVYSPQWWGESGEIDVDPRTEVLVSSKTVDKWHKEWSYDSGHEDIYLRWQTIRAKDGSYTRSTFCMMYDGMPHAELIGARTFGFKYAHRKAYHRYRSDYLRFKESLVQYAD